MSEGGRLVYDVQTESKTGSFPVDAPESGGFRWNGCALIDALDQSFQIKNAIFPHHTILLQLDGPLEFDFGPSAGRQHLLVRPGEIVAFPARRQVWMSGQGKGNTISVLIEEKLFAFAQAQLGLVESVSLKAPLGADDPLARELILGLREESRKGRLGNSNYAEALALALTSHLIQRYGGSAGTVPEPNGRTGLTRAQLRRVIEHIHLNLAQRISLAELAVQANLSIYHFARLFKQSTGFSPHEYMNRRRVERAKELLLQTPQPNTAEIARQVGFCDQSHLGRHFRRIAGVSPREFIRGAFSLPEASH